MSCSFFIEISYNDYLLDIFGVFSGMFSKFKYFYIYFLRADFELDFESKLLRHLPECTIVRNDSMHIVRKHSI
jgi:hypothetical protein